MPLLQLNRFDKLTKPGVNSKRSVSRDLTSVRTPLAKRTLKIGSDL